MNVLFLTVLLSLILLGIFLLAFFWESRGKSFSSMEQESLKPLQDEESTAESKTQGVTNHPPI